jgi:hypothetical protein
MCHVKSWYILAYILGTINYDYYFPMKPKNLCFTVAKQESVQIGQSGINLYFVTLLFVTTLLYNIPGIYDGFLRNAI